MRTILALALLLLAVPAKAALFPTSTPSASGGGAREIMLEPATALIPDTSFGSVVRTQRTNIVDLTGVFTNGVDQNMFWTFGVPSNYSGNVTATVYWSSAVADDTKIVVWEIGSRSLADGGTWDSAITRFSVADANKATANQMNEASVTITAPWTAGQLAQLQVHRNGGAPTTDSLAAVANLYHVKLAW